MAEMKRYEWVPAPIQDTQINTYKEVKMNYGIIGYGYVGQAVHNQLIDNNYENNITIYDPYKGYNDLDSILKADQVFICVPTPAEEDNRFYHAFEETMHLLNTYNGIIVIKSTVPYSRIENYFYKKIVYCSEFLNQNSFLKDSETENLILGGDFNLCLEVSKSFRNKCRIVPLKDAINFKYVRNILGAYKVLFWNFVQETTGNARLMKDLLDFIPQGPLDQVGMDGHLGYGGCCFPKDVKNFNKEHPNILTDFMIKYNEYLHKLKSFNV